MVFSMGVLCSFLHIADGESPGAAEVFKQTHTRENGGLQSGWHGAVVQALRKRERGSEAVKKRPRGGMQRIEDIHERVK